MTSDVGSSRPACDSDRHVTVNNIQVILVCGRPGDRGGGNETPAASVPLYFVLCQWHKVPGTIRGRLFLRKGIELSNTVS